MKLLKCVYGVFSLLILMSVISSCSSGVCNSNNSDGPVTFSIDNPAQYPAGVPITAYLVITNTSTNDAKNLAYTVPSPSESGNTTGVTIIPDAGIGSPSKACANIKAGQPCTFKVTIPQGSNPGSFVVTATPNSVLTKLSNGKSITKALNDSSISVQAYLGLVDTPNTENSYFVLPETKTIVLKDGKPTVQAMVSVWIKKADKNLNTIKLTDENGQPLTFYPAQGSTPNYAVNSVNTYVVDIPANKSVQHIQALSNVCDVANNTGDNYNACSNNATVFLSISGSGVLSVEPGYINMSESYNSQVITLFNSGDANVKNITSTIDKLLPQFRVIDNNCGDILTPSALCTMKLVYTPNTTSGFEQLIFSYNDSNAKSIELRSAAVNFSYTGTNPSPFSVLLASPSIVHLDTNNKQESIVLTNVPGGVSVGATITNLSMPTLLPPLRLVSNTCAATLAVGSSCSYVIDYSGKSSGNTSLGFEYNNGVSAQTTAVQVDWVGLPVPFQTTWKTTISNQTITLPIYDSGTYNFTVNWGDGSQIESCLSAACSAKTHTYANAGTYVVTLTGVIDGYNFALEPASASHIINVLQWGDVMFGSESGIFESCANFESIPATDVPNFIGTTRLYYMFAFDPKFVGGASLGNWDMTKIDAVGGMFQGDVLFNESAITSWNTAGISEFWNIFNGATIFNQPVGVWDMSSATHIEGMFKGATTFNQPLNNWNVSNAEYMMGMFYGATSFNQPLNNWNVSNVINMNNMFNSATIFNQPLNNWDVAKVTSMGGMFNDAIVFDQPLNNWNVSNVTNMNSLFNGATSFNQALDNWNVSNVSSMGSMFNDATSFNQPLNSWNVSNVTNMANMFNGATSFNQALNNWNVSKVDNMSHMFDGAILFNQPLNNWDVSSVDLMAGMFNGATSFNNDISEWSVTSVRTCNGFSGNSSGLNGSVKRPKASKIGVPAQTGACYISASGGKNKNVFQP